MRVFLPVYFAIATAAVFIIRVLIVRRRTGVDPLAENWQDDLRGYVARLLVLTEGLVVVDVAIYAASPAAYSYLGPFRGLEHPAVQAVGATMLVAALIWVVAAQSQMGDSWRIGVDPDARTDLVTGGLFAWSRNPVFLGMRISLVGIFLVTPNLVSLLAMVLGEVVIQAQVRIEEEYLGRVHAGTFERYRAQVRRWI